MGVLRTPLKAVFDVAGQADVASGIKTPETAERRANIYANIPIPMAVAALTGGASLPAQSMIQMGTTAAMQEGGFEPKSPGQVVASGAAPFLAAGLGRLVRGVGRGITRVLPERFKAAHQAAQAGAGELAESLKPPVVVGEAFKGARAAGAEKIPAAQLTAMLDDLEQTIPANPTSPGLKTAREFMDSARQSVMGGEVSLGDLMRFRLDLGRSVGKAPELGALYKAVLGDLEQAGAGAGPGANLALQALDAARRERGVSLLQGMTERASRGRSALTGDQPLLSIGQLSRDVQKHKDELQKFLGPQGVSRIEEFLTRNAALPPMHAWTGWNTLLGSLGGLGGLMTGTLPAVGGGIALQELVRNAVAVGKNPAELNRFLIMLGAGARTGIGPAAEKAVEGRK